MLKKVFGMLRTKIVRKSAPMIGDLDVLGCFFFPYVSNFSDMKFSKTCPVIYDLKLGRQGHT